MRVKVGFVFLAALCQSVHADKASFQVGISQALESLEQASLDRDSAEAGMSAGRKLFVQHLLKEISSEESTRVDVPALLRLIEEILVNISNFIKAERDTDQAWYLSKKNKHDDCPNNTAQTEDGQMEGAKNSALRSHYNCRILEEKPYGTQSDTSCAQVSSAIHTWISGTAPTNGFPNQGQGSSMAMNCDDWPGSASHLNDAGVIDSELAKCFNVDDSNVCRIGTYSKPTFEALFFTSDEVGGLQTWYLGGQPAVGGPWHHMSNFLTVRKELFSTGTRGNTPTDATSCEANFASWQDTNGYGGIDIQYNNGTHDIETCDKRQRNYEAAYCSFQWIRQRRCADLRQCYWREEAVFNQEHTNVFNRQTVRVRDNAVVMYVACIVGRLAVNQDEDFALTNTSCAGTLELTQYKTGCVAGAAPTYSIPAGCSHGNAPLTLGNPLACDNSTASQASPSVVLWETQEYKGGVDHDSDAGTPKRNHAGETSTDNPILDVSSYSGYLIERRNRQNGGLGDYHC